jgi:hypothetical protein
MNPDIYQRVGRRKASAYGFTLIDKDSFHLIRSYETLEQRKESQEAFYGSDEWINGPEKAIMSCIDTYNTTVVSTAQLPNFIL